MKVPPTFLICLILGLGLAMESSAKPVKLSPADPVKDQWFGWSVAVDEKHAIVGSPKVDDKGPNAGAAYPYVRIGDTWKAAEPVKIFPIRSGERDEFGSSVALSGATAIVGAPGNEKGTGAVFVFIYNPDGERWQQQAKLTAQDKAAGDQFGWSLAINGNVAIIGARFDDDDGKSSGSAYIFVRNGESWIQQAKLTADDGATSDNFGQSVSISEDFAIVGAPKHAQAGLKQSGAAYIFGRNGDSWGQKAKLTANDLAAKDQFGFSVAISGDVAIVGAPQNDGNAADTGAAYIFNRSGNTWLQHSKLASKDADEKDQFGNAVSIFYNIAFVGAKFDDELGNDAGAAYSFLREGDVWNQKKKVTIEAKDAQPEIRVHLGISVSIRSQFAITGGEVADADVGAAYIYDVARDLDAPFPVEPRFLSATTFGHLKHTALYQNFPNPFNPETWFPYQLSNDANVVFHIYNISGQLVQELNLGMRNKGSYLDKHTAAYWNGRDSYGQFVSSGIYILDFKAGAYRTSRKMVVLK